MKLSIKQNWFNSLEFLTAKLFILIPFIMIAVFEGLALELIYFSTREPLSYIFSPIIRKFFGEAFLHYPDHLLLLPKLFYYAQVGIYVTVGVSLVASAVNIFNNVKLGLPIKAKTVIKNTVKRYGAYLAYGIFVIALTLLLKRADRYLLTGFFKMASEFAPNATVRLAPYISSLSLFALNMIMQVFVFLTIPILVIQKKSFFKALAKSFYMGARNFFHIFVLILVPNLLYLPILLLYGNTAKLIDLTSPEIMVYLSAAGIIVTMFIGCFVIVCLSQFLINMESLKKR